MRPATPSSGSVSPLLSAPSGGGEQDGASGQNGVAMSLCTVLARHAALQGVSLDTMQLRAVVRETDAASGFSGLRRAVVALGRRGPMQLKLPDRARLPMLCFLDQHWSLVTDRDPDGAWRVENEEGTERRTDDELRNNCFHIEWRADGNADRGTVSDAPFSAAIRRVLRRYRRSVTEAAIASAFIGTLALMTSMFSMQVYDRVIPLKGEYTLFVLGLGVLISVGIEHAMRHARASVMHEVAVGMDGQLSREIFERFLRIRLDQLPTDVGSLAGMLRGYEQIRNFYTASTLFALIDIPMALLFVVLIAHFASPVVAAVPFLFAFCALIIGALARIRFMRLAAEGAVLGNSKTGLLVEAVEGAETIKSGAGGWKFLSRWMRLNADAIHNDLKLRRSSESVSHASAAIQQLSYAGLIGVGAYVVMAGEMTTGALVACSILSSRVLQPIVMLPNLMLQQAHARAAVAGLDKLYRLKNDNHGVDRALIPSSLQGHYRVEQAAFVYADSPPSLQMGELEIRPGERVGVLGPIGSGKSTLLRLLSGMYTTHSGRVLIDGLDISHVSREVLARHVGYLQQEHRLFQGSLRDNLLIGLPDPGDDALMSVMERTGMASFVTAHPRGLDRAIAEGGKGLSGGQRQLLAFTRLVLTRPAVMLLDEPTANMDNVQERRCLEVLAHEARHQRTMVIVTHKPTLLPLVQRIIVVLNGRIVMDGPRDEVLRQLNTPAQAMPSDSTASGASSTPCEPAQTTRPASA